MVDGAQRLALDLQRDAAPGRGGDGVDELLHGAEAVDLDLRAVAVAIDDEDVGEHVGAVGRQAGAGQQVGEQPIFGGALILDHIFACGWVQIRYQVAGC